MRNSFTLVATTILVGCSSPPSSTMAEQSAAQADVTEDSSKLWVTAQHADRYTCPSKNCGVVGRLYFREAATPLETKGQWVRITKFYDASCEGGKSAYVDKGNNACTTENGIKDGQFAEWIEADQLSKTRPVDPAATASTDEQLVKGSDDFNIYHAQFAKLAQNLIEEGRCTDADFKEQGGFMKSVNTDEPVYFIYCGGMTTDAKVYVNAKSETVE